MLDSHMIGFLLKQSVRRHINKMNVIMERYPYRYVEVGTLENGKPDFRIQKQDHYTKRYKDMYLCDNGLQLTQAIEDFEYTK